MSTFRLVHATARAGACDAIRAAPDGHIVRIEEPKKSRDQECRYHAMIADIAKQTTFHGLTLKADDAKRLLIDAFRWDTKDVLADEWAKFGEMRLAPAINHSGFVVLGEQSRGFSVRLASAFIEWLAAYGAEKDVVWSEPARSWGDE
jgi:hypothetical protein